MAGSNSIKATKRLALADALSQLCSGSNRIVAGGLGPLGRRYESADCSLGMPGFLKEASGKFRRWPAQRSVGPHNMKRDVIVQRSFGDSNQSTRRNGCVR